ncbi:SusC/RagA family TonB-linked outer membrane protein [Chryseobacterium sp. MP_3.2]|uniref:SusC/RagA family TonB-linked outer membrane protein n=1 Tax=Chryseobacterium sp. MP_3.2 TaxID=3071712 RepID=UPI002E039690|nr:TonB-linked SusC/RagA family outer membrane protein [Chryseobacterium sp. MP_3.2]
MRKHSFLLLVPGLFFSQQTTKKDTIGEIAIKEVVITSSYGTKKLKEEVVGSIVSINAREINTSQAYESIDKMIIGLTPGVQISGGSELGKPVAINIRGLGSLVGLNGNNLGTSTQPLIIIDGIIIKEDKPFDAQFFNGVGDSELNFNSLARVSTDNIENISILKDAAAVALYGADAANGVIIITTKKGKKGKPKYSYTSQFGVSAPINKVKYLNAQQYTELYSAYRKNNGQSSILNNGVDVDWFEVMNQPGDYYKTNFGVNGGKNNFTYRFGLDYSKNNEAKLINNLEKKGIDATIGFDWKKLNISLYTQYSELEKEAPNQFFNFILAPNFPIYNSERNYSLTGTKGIPNPLAAANQNISNTKSNSLLSSINVGYEVFTNFRISSIFGVDYSKKNDVNWRSGLNESGQRNGNFIIDNVAYPNNGTSILKNSKYFKWNWSAQASYQKSFGEKHSLDGILGIETRADEDDKNYESGRNFINFSQYQLPSQAAQYIDFNNLNDPNDDVLIYGYTTKKLTSKNRGRSYFLQVNYDYAKKYFFSGTVRRDESSAFGNDINAAFNGGAGLSWVISNEKWIKSQTWIDFLRLRSSWGITGNSRIGSYRSSGLYNIYQNGFEYDFDYGYPDSGSPRNAELGWEKNEKYNTGLDLNFFKKIEITVELFRNNLSDMIVSREVPLEIGYTSAQINGAAMYNQGIEFSTKINWFKKKNFIWTTNFNISTVENKVTDLLGFGTPYSIASNARSQKIGTSTSAIWGYEWLGVNPENGQDSFLIDGVPTDANKITLSTANWKIIGNSQPDAIGGLRNSLTYRNFNLSFLFNFEWGGDQLILGELIDQHRILSNRNMSVNAYDYWSPTNPNASNHIPKNNNRIVPNSTKFLYDNTFIKFQNVNLSYRLPFRPVKSYVIKEASIFLDATNLGYWYKQKSPAGKNGIREFRYLYPEMRTVSLGFRMNF